MSEAEVAEPLGTTRRWRGRPRRAPVPRRLGGILRELVRRPAGIVGLVMVGGLVFAAVFAPLLAPHDPAAQDVYNRLAGPSWSHPFGTDNIGRDLLSRVLYGARMSLEVAIPAVLLALLVGLLLGLTSGYVGGLVDTAIGTVTDALQAFPALVLALALLAAVGPSQRNLILVIAVAFTPGYIRIARALVLNMKHRPFVLAEQALGAKTAYIIRRHVFPSVVPTLLVLVAIDLATAMVVESGLSFLGLGVQPPTPSWGSVLFEGFQFVRVSPWAVIWSGLALMVATLGFTILGETTRDIVDPRLASHRVRQI